jgi:ligand-binding sensor domain-containing protein
MRARIVVGIAAAAAAFAGARALVRYSERIRHLAVPVLADASLPRPRGAAIAELAGCEAQEVARLGRRVTALLVASDGALVAGTFDDGVFRLEPPEGELLQGEPLVQEEPLDGEPRWDAAGAAAVSGFEGRERFVNALAERDGLVWVATQGGLVALDGARRALSLLEGEGVTALATAGGALHAGTARGLRRISVERGAEPVAVTGPSGEPLRVTALAASGDRLWIGTASGAYSLPLATLLAPLESRTARWHPLVFGDPPADTNVVTALVALADGAVAGTDDGGVVRLREDGGVAAVRFDEAKANEVNPGAAAAEPGGGAALGTQGGGIVFSRTHGAGLDVARPSTLARAEVTALTAWPGGLLAATADGTILRIACEPPRSW